MQILPRIQLIYLYFAGIFWLWTNGIIQIWAALFWLRVDSIHLPLCWLWIGAHIWMPFVLCAVSLTNNLVIYLQTQFFLEISCHLTNQTNFLFLRRLVQWNQWHFVSIVGSDFHGVHYLLAINCNGLFWLHSVEIWKNQSTSARTIEMPIGSVHSGFSTSCFTIVMQFCWKWLTWFE